MNLLIITRVILAACLLLCGCGRRKQESSFAGSTMHIQKTNILTLRKGITRRDVEKALGGPGQYQFSARLATGDYFCASYAFEKPDVYYYFLFQGDLLEKILAPPTFDVDLVPYKAFYREIKKPCNADKRIEMVLQGSGLSCAELVDALHLALSKTTETFDVLPALIVSSRLLSIDAKARRLHYEKNASLAEQFDPAKIKLADTETSLIPKYGPPLALVTNGAIHVYQFDSNVALDINPAYRFSGVSVVTENGLVTRIFCHDFVCTTTSAITVDPYDDPERPNYFCKVHRVYFDDPKSPHMNH
jgi:hypothetical protein